MVLFNYTTMQMTAKIVYYGPGLCGKTTNLQAIHQKTASSARGEMVSLETETDRTLFFDLLPLDVGVIGGMKVRLQLYTVPGQVFYNATRKLVLKGVDGVVFVADSQVPALEANVESLKNLDENLAELGVSLDQIPLVFQYNKRDLRQIHAVEKLNEVLNPGGRPWFEAAARHGVGVFETLKAITRLALGAVRQKLASGEPRARPSVFGVSTHAKPAPPAVPSAATAAALASAHGDEVKVEFAEEDTGKHQVRAVRTKHSIDIQQELAQLRTMAGVAKPSVAPVNPISDRRHGGRRATEQRLEELLVAERESRQSLKKKASLEVPARLLKESQAVRITIAFEGDDGQEQLLGEPVTVRLAGNRHLEQLTIGLDLELKGKS